MDQSNLVHNMEEFNDKSRSTTKDDKDTKRNTLNDFDEGWKLTPDAFKSGIITTKKNKEKDQKY